MARAEQVRQERRRRRDVDYTSSAQLYYPEDLKDPAYAYRWINEGDGSRRLIAMTKQDDWDVVTDDTADKDGEGTPVRRVVGTLAGGQPQYAYLCRKRLEWYEEDRKRTVEKRNDDIMQQIKSGAVEAGGLQEGERYTPTEGISIRSEVGSDRSAPSTARAKRRGEYQP